MPMLSIQFLILIAIAAIIGFLLSYFFLCKYICGRKGVASSDDAVSAKSAAAVGTAAAAGVMSSAVTSKDQAASENKAASGAKPAASVEKAADKPAAKASATKQSAPASAKKTTAKSAKAEASTDAADKKPAAKKAPAKKAPAKKASAKSAAKVPAPAAPMSDADKDAKIAALAEIKVTDDDKPATLSAPRGGSADNLKRIKGIGPVNEKRLHDAGFYHFDQIASWGDREIAWMDQFLTFKGRIVREEWVRQAGQLASGQETDFSKRVDRGEVDSSKG